MRLFLKVCAAVSLFSAVLRLALALALAARLLQHVSGGSASAHTGTPLRSASKSPQIGIQHPILTGFSEAIFLADVQSSALTS